MNQKILGDKRKLNFDEGLADVVNKIYENMPETPGVKPVVSNVSLDRDNEGFIFYNLPEVGSVKLIERYMKGGKHEDQNYWMGFGGASDLITVPNTVVLYQILRALYELKNSKDDYMLAIDCFRLFDKDWENDNRIQPYTGTKIEYTERSLNSVIHHVQLNGSIKRINLKIPEFINSTDKFSYLVLAPDQPEDKLGNVNEIPDNAKPVLHALFGEGYEKAGEIFQDFGPRGKNNDLREVRLWIPKLENRIRESAVILGGSNSVHGFCINADVDIYGERPARGVVKMRKNSGMIAI